MPRLTSPSAAASKPANSPFAGATYASTARRAREGQRLVEAYRASPAELERRLAMSEIHVRPFAG